MLVKRSDIRVLIRKLEGKIDGDIIIEFFVENFDAKTGEKTVISLKDNKEVDFQVIDHLKEQEANLVKCDKYPNYTCLFLNYFPYPKIYPNKGNTIEAVCDAFKSFSLFERVWFQRMDQGGEKYCSQDLLKLENDINLLYKHKNLNTEPCK